MLARPAASAIAAASLKSFLLLLRYGFTNCAGRIRTSWPASVNTRPQYCEPGHDSVATMHRGAVAANWVSCERFIFLRKTAAPAASRPTRWNQFFPRSMPIIAGCVMCRSSRMAGHHSPRGGADHSITPQWRATPGLTLVATGDCPGATLGKVES